MPVVGSREVRKPGSNGYTHDPMMGYAKEFLNLSSSILEEGRLDLFSEPAKVLRRNITDSTMKNFFIEGSADPKGMTAEEYEDHIEMMEQMYENDKEAVLEHSGMGQYNPVIGMTFPIHKNIMMNNIFDKGAIPKLVATSPKFTVSMETRWLVDPDGNKIDMWREQWKMTDAIDKAAPMKSIYMDLPETQTTNIIEKLGYVEDQNTNLSIESYVSGLVVSSEDVGRVMFPAQVFDVVVKYTVDSAEVTEAMTVKNNGATPVIILKGCATTDLLFNGQAATAYTDLEVVGPVFQWKGNFTPAYGSYDRQLMEQHALPLAYKTAPAVSTTVSGAWKIQAINWEWVKNGAKEDGTAVTTLAAAAVDFDGISDERMISDRCRLTGFVSGFSKDNRFGISSSAVILDPKGTPTTLNVVSGIIFTSRIDTSSAMLKTSSVSWSVRTDIIEIPNRVPINVTISPEEVKDISALYQINQLTKVMSLMKVSLANYKDDHIRRFLDESFVTMPDDCKIGRSFDFAPSQSYALDPIEWRYKTFMDSLDTHATQLLHVLNDPNVTFNIIGRDDLIRKITPTDYTYQSPSSIGPVELDFVKTVVTSDKRTYQFISSDKLRDTNNLMIILCPRNSERFIYRIYDYQMYLSNEIRNYTNPSLPAVHAFERWIAKEYQPVQGRIRILNPTGLRNYATDYSYNNDPIGRGDGVRAIGKNDFDIDRV